MKKIVAQQIKGALRRRVYITALLALTVVLLAVATVADWFYTLGRAVVAVTDDKVREGVREGVAVFRHARSVW